MQNTEQDIDRRILVSHSVNDANLAKLISDLIFRCSLQQIIPWYSSDSSGSGGIQAGDRWFERVREELTRSKAVLVLLTPESIKSSWVQFEAGFGAASGELEILPVVFNLDDFADIPNPITHWQIYRLDGVQDCVDFLEKLFSRMSVHFDEELIKPRIIEFITQLTELKKGGTTEKIPDSNEKGEFDNLKKYLDRKFIDIASRLSDKETNFSHYNFDIQNNINAETRISIIIDINTSFADALNDIYFQISDYVDAYKYMETWILRDVESNQRLILREIAGEVPASRILRSGRKIVAERLDRPYEGTDSVNISEYHSGFYPTDVL